MNSARAIETVVGEAGEFMKAKELIEILSQHPEAEVLCPSGSPEQPNTLVRAATRNVESGYSERRQFRDMMDYETYLKRVWFRSLSDGRKDAVPVFIMGEDYSS